MAEGILKKKLPAEFQTQVRVVSAGTLGIWGSAPSQEAIQVAKEIGVDISFHRSQGVSAELVKNAQIILVMAENHLNFMVDTFPGSENKVFLLKAFENKLNDGDGVSIPDPIGLSIEVYRQVCQAIETHIDRLLPKLDGIIQKFSKA
jgi:protein-tyrosine phosphatase